MPGWSVPGRTSPPVQQVRRAQAVRGGRATRAGRDADHPQRLSKSVQYLPKWRSSRFRSRLRRTRPIRRCVQRRQRNQNLKPAQNPFFFSDCFFFLRFARPDLRREHGVRPGTRVGVGATRPGRHHGQELHRADRLPVQPCLPLPFCDANVRGLVHTRVWVGSYAQGFDKRPRARERTRESARERECKSVQRTMRGSGWEGGCLYERRHAPLDLMSSVLENSPITPRTLKKR